MLGLQIVRVVLVCCLQPCRSGATATVESPDHPTCVSDEVRLLQRTHNNSVIKCPYVNRPISTVAAVASLMCQAGAWISLVNKCNSCAQLRSYTRPTQIGEPSFVH